MAGVGKTVREAAKSIKLPKGAYSSWDVTSDISFTPDGDEISGEPYVLIEKLFVPKESTGKGHGRQLLRQTLAEIKAEHPNLPIKLAALPTDHQAMAIDDLVRFYESEGFDVSGDAGGAVVMDFDGIIRSGKGALSGLGLAGAAAQPSDAMAYSNAMLGQARSPEWQATMAPGAPMIHGIGSKLMDIQLPGNIKPFEGIGDYLINYGYDDPYKTKLKRAFWAGMDLL